MASYRTDREWSDAYIPQIKAAVAPHLLEPAPFELDAKEATDLLVFKARDVRIAARLRRPGYADRYGHQFTIRTARDSGAKTELEKIVDGWGDWFFYGHADHYQGLALWWLLDLASFRAALIRKGFGKANIRYEAKSNGDGTHFAAFDIHSFPDNPPFVIASSEGRTWRAEAVASRRDEVFA